MDSGEPSNCPSREDLERFAAGTPRGASHQEHVQSCPHCLLAMERMREDNALIREFARSAPLLAQSSFGAASLPVIDGYQMQAEIHRGGQGVVYRAVQLKTKRIVAVKTLAPGSSIGARQRRRFEREIEVVAQLRHPHIVTLFESDVTRDGLHYFVMEYVQGVRLNEHVQSSNGLPIRSILQLFSEICGAVQFAHQRGVIHRDLKPANILVDRDGIPHVLDFGLAKALGAEFSPDPYTITRGGEFLGTLAYASPEQVRTDSNQVDTRTDVYALGVVLYEMLTGTHPYPVDGALSDVVRSITEIEPARPSLQRRDVDNDLETIVLKTLAKDPQRRYQSAEALHRDVVRYLGGEPIDAKRDSTWYVLRKTLRQYRRAAVVAIGFVLLLAVVAVMMSVQAGRLAQERNQLQRTNRALQFGQARQALLAGNYAVAEEGFWKAHLDPVEYDSRSDGFGPAGPFKTQWALRELYSHQPCLESWTTSDVNGYVADIAVSRDGALLATTRGEDKPLQLWELPGGRLLETIETSSAVRLLFLPDGNRLAWLTRDGAICLWNMGERRIEAQTNVPLSEFRQIAVSPESSVLLVGTGQGIRVFRLPTLEPQGEVGDHADSIWAISFDRTGQTLAAMNEIGRLTLFRWPSREKLATYLPPPGFSRHSIHLIRFYPDGSEVALITHTDVVSLGLTTGEFRTIATHRANVLAVQFEPRGQWLASGDDGGMLELTPTGHSTEDSARSYYHAGLRDFTLIPGSDLIASAGMNGVIKLWETTSRPSFHDLTVPMVTVHFVCYSRDGRLLALSGGDLVKPDDEADIENRIQVWDTKTNVMVREFRGHESVVAAVAFHPSVERIASASYDRTIRLWDIPTGECLWTIAAHNDRISTIAFSPDGNLIASGGDDNVVKLWDASTGELLHTFSGHQIRIPFLCFSPDGTLIASCSTGGDTSKIFLHEIASKRSHELYRHHATSVRALAFRPDGRILASAGDDRRMRLWDVGTRTLVAEWETPPHSVFSLDFHPDGRMLASAGRGNEITLWDTANPSEPYLATLRGHPNMVFSLDFHPDGRILASGGADRTAGIWDLSYYDRHIEGNREHQARLHARPPR